MRQKFLSISLAFLLIAASMLSGCKKDKQIYSGTDTIDNVLVPSGQTFAIFGFSFELGRVISNLEPPGPDITIHLRTDISGVTGKYFDTDTFVESFALAGEYGSATEAKTAFDDLVDVGSPTWFSTAEDLEENQVWLFRTTEGNYVKLRLTDLTVDEQQDPPYIQVTFQWRIQPDGSSSFSK